jgi:hypothetical protein
MDGVKMFDEDEENLQKIKRDNKLSNRSDCHRLALKVCANLGQIPQELRNIEASQQDGFKQLSEHIQQIYFILQEKMK